MALKKIVKEFIALDTREALIDLRRKNPKGWLEYNDHLRSERKKAREARIKKRRKGTN